MSHITSLTRKGQVAIPKEVRVKLGLKAFDKIEVEVEGGEARLRKARPSLEEVAGTLPPLDVPIEEMPTIAKHERAKRRISKLS
ncbi:MAG: AbrB/MazE/SpoVT family DNA-binding domain-containing protein [Chloroflexota bacterium]|nr:MAG: AbrB/MazE/SpoVT family DNA-binding domain-containing protein [Chloroflexota bacterium]